LIIDTSAIIAILAAEADAAHYAEAIEKASNPRISTGTLLEATLVLTRWYGNSASQTLDNFVRESGAEVIPFDLSQLRAAQSAFLYYGKGRHPAGLDFGDCISYALAKVCDEPLLFKGDDFSQTDLKKA
jgi:ribonuclease VapC